MILVYPTIKRRLVFKKYYNTKLGRSLVLKTESRKLLKYFVMSIVILMNKQWMQNLKILLKKRKEYQNSSKGRNTLEVKKIYKLTLSAPAPEGYSSHLV